MELRHLRYFVTVAEELHFGRAAERLHVAQPAVSEQIRRLEDELGVRLLRRSSRVVELTEPGRALLDDARRLLEQADAATRSLQRWRRGGQARLRLGYLVDTVPATLPLVLSSWRDDRPGVQFEMRAGRPAQLLADVRSDRLDVALITLPASTDGLRITAAGEERAVVAVGTGSSPDAGPAPLRLCDIAGAPVLTLPRERNPGFFDAVVAAFHAGGHAPDMTVLDGGTVEHLLLEVAAGGGVALVPASVQDRLVTPGVTFHLLDDAGPRVARALVTRDEVPSATLLELLRRFSSALPRAGRPRREPELAAA
ncbi:MAG TPA: LysR family transcriptional regulator [Baekduia sp.]